MVMDGGKVLLFFFANTKLTKDNKTIDE